MVQNDCFRTSTLRAPAASVDLKAEVIRGAKVIQAGDTNDDRPITIDAETLAQVVEYGNRPNRGIKARFTHPSMSDDGLGRFLGRWEDFRVDGDAVLADLHISPTAHETPDGDIADYVLALAAEDPEAFGVSIVAGPDQEAMQKLREGLEDGARVPLRLAKLRAADIVDEPAATRGGLFSMQLDDPRSIAAIASRMIETHFAEMEPEEILERFRGLLSRHFNQTIKGSIMANESDAIEVAETDQAVAADTQLDQLVSVEVGDPNEFVEAFGDRGARWYLEGLSLEECYRQRCRELEEMCSNLEVRLDAALGAVGEPAPVSHSQPEPTMAEALKAQRQTKIEEDKKKGMSESAARWARLFEKSDQN